MKNHELLELIGDVNEDYVLEAEDNVVKPRFGWRKLAVCAACAALVLAYPVYRAVHPPLHSYTVLEDATGPQVLAQGGSGTPELSTPEPAPAVDDQHYDVSVQARANAQYQGLLNGMGGQEGCEPKIYPDWYGGSWIHDTGDRLAVALVDGFHTSELEARIEEWCGGEVVFVQDMKYSYAHLLSLHDQILQVWPEDNAWSTLTSIVTDMKANCLEVGFSGSPSDTALAFLAQLDPDGDAIQVQAFTSKLDTLTDEAVKGPATNSEPDAYAPAPGGVTHPTAEEGEQMKEENRAAVYDLPQGKDDVLAEGE